MIALSWAMKGEYHIKILLSVAFLLLSGISQALTHTVKAKETFYSIARKHGVTVKALMSKNSMKDAKRLMIGKRLVIPSKVKSAKSSNAKKKSVYVASRASDYYRKSSKSRGSKFRVVVDPGHGGRDMGAYWHGVRESDLNMRVARKVAASLKARGYPVTMTRRSDVFISLSRRAQIANRFKNAIFVSIHFNATNNTKVSGAETYYSGRKSRHLASCIQSRLIKRLHVRNRGVRRGRYAVLVGTKCPAVLVECGFISNSYERKRCKTGHFQTQAAHAIVNGIVSYDRVY